MRRIVVPLPKNQLSLFEALENPRALIWIDAEPIRQQWIRRYHLFAKKLEKAKKEWRLFEQDSIPLYQKWYYSTFAKELARNTEWNEKAREQEMILAAISAHRAVYGLADLEAYSRVQLRLQKKQDPFPDEEDLARYRKKMQERDEADRRRREEIRERREAEAKRRQEELAKAFWDTPADQQNYAEEIEAAAQEWFTRNQGGDGQASETTEGSAHESTQEPSSGPASFHRPVDDFKTLYRKIVRALHPDSGHEMTAIEKEWWHTTQDAYRRRDLHTLQLIALKIEGRGEVPIEQVEHISTLIELCASLLDQQDQIAHEKKHLRKDPIYRFWASRGHGSNREKLEMELAAQLNFQFRRLKDFVEQVRESFRELDHLRNRSGEGGEWMDENGNENSSRRSRHSPSEEKSGGGRGRGRSRSRRR